MTSKFKLSIELVPASCWYKSLRELLPRKVWLKIREERTLKTGGKCEICGSAKKPLSLHEVWVYDDEKHIQKLNGFCLLCRKCHWIKHIGLASMMPVNYENLITHFCKINNCSRRDFEQHKEIAYRLWSERSKFNWTQDFGEYHIFIQRKGIDNHNGAC